MRKALIAIFLVLIADQTLKIWVKTHMLRNEAIKIFGNYFQIHFIENNGMAFGMEFHGSYGKIFLSVFRIVVVIALGWYLKNLIKEKAHSGLIISGSLIFAGAIGNIIDSAFYGMIFTHSTEFELATMFPVHGYSTFLHGSVVDMLYFPLLHGYFPDWLPIWGGEDYEFFRPVFNIADSSITIGVALILIYQKRFFHHANPAVAEETTPPADETSNIGTEPTEAPTELINE
ncbi:MAG: lipoprotein signal peptidase [Bacteroidota bacterium]